MYELLFNNNGKTICYMVRTIYMLSAIITANIEKYFNILIFGENNPPCWLPSGRGLLWPGFYKTVDLILVMASKKKRLI